MQKVELVRGTSLTLEITITDVYGNPYSMSSGQVVVFGVKQELDDEKLVIKKLVTTGSGGVFKVTLSPQDTESLEPGRYHYDVGLADGSEYHGVIDPNPFILKENVTKRGDAR